MTKTQVPLANRNGKPGKPDCSDTQVAKIKKEMTFAQKEIAHKNQLHQAKENWVRERSERGSKGKKEDSQDDEVGSRLLHRQAKQGRTLKPASSPPSPPRK